MKERITSRGVVCIFPEGIKIKPMGGFIKFLVGQTTPAITYNQTIHLNYNILPWCSPETMIHESVHLFQERRMGKLDYYSTYFWQIFISTFRAGTSHIHDDHLMEREARRIAQEIVKSTAGQTEIDIEAEIKKNTGW